MFEYILAIAVVLLGLGLLFRWWISAIRRGGYQEIMSLVGEAMLLVVGGQQSHRDRRRGRNPH